MPDEPGELEPSGLWLIDVEVIDGTGAAPRPHQDVVVTGGAIAAVEPTGSRPMPSGPGHVRVVHGAGLTVLPGFIDCHTHMTTVPGAGGLSELMAPETLRTLRAVPQLRATLDAGVTTVRDLAGCDSGIRRALDAGLVAGPRMRTAIRMLSITGGHGDWRTVDGVPLDIGPGAGVVADSPAGFVRETREVIRQGADWVKVAATGGMSSPGSSPDYGGLTEAEIRAVVVEADRHGIVGVAAHAQGAAGIAAAVRTGVRSIEHGYLVDDATVEEMLARGTFLVPTLATLTRPAGRGANRWSVEKRRTQKDLAVERLRTALGAGVRVAMGTDAGIAEHGANLRELALLVEFGLSPMAAIVAGTSAAAELCGLADEVGTVRPGRRADLVAVAVDPLRDIAALQDPGTVRLVVQDGRIVKDGRAPGRRDPQEGT